MRRALPLLLLASVTSGIALVACTEEADESGGGPTPSPSVTTIVTPPPLALDSSISGSISTPGEQDLYALTIDAPIVEIDLDADGFNAGNRLDARLIVYDGDGAILRVVDDGTTVAKPPRMRDPFVVLEVPAGQYFVGVEDAVGDGGATGFAYALHARRVTPVARPGAVTCTGAVLLTNLNGVFEGPATETDMQWSINDQSLTCVGSPVPGQDHVYRATLTSGVGYQIVQTTKTWDGAFYIATGCTSGGGFTQADFDLLCRAGADGTDGADGVVFRPLVTGEYFLHVDGVVQDVAGEYRLHVRTLP